jgi:hypothetical protein
MSHTATTWAWKQNIPYRAKFTLIALADWYNELESCAWPSLRQLSEKMGMPYGTVRDSLRWLVEVDLVVIEPHFKNNKQQSNRYRLPVNMIVFQGVEPQQGGVAPQQGGVEAQHPIEDTVKDTGKDTVISAAPDFPSDSKEKTNVKVEEVLTKFNYGTKEEIYARFDPRPSGCKMFWLAARATAANDNGHQGEISTARQKKLNDRRKEVGNDQLFMDTIWKACADWVAFRKFAEKHHGAYNMGLVPTIDKIHYFWDAAVDYAQQNKPVQSIAKPLTNKPAAVKPIPKAKPKAEATPYVNPYHPKPKKTPEEKAAIMAKHSKVDS